MKSIMFLCFEKQQIIFYLIILVKSEYEIKENIVPSYLMKTFYNLSEDIFPYDIKMSMSMTRVTGTLLYSIDSNGNQMIVSLNDVTEPTLEIEFSKQHFYVTLPQLCGCKICRFEKITLRIQMKDLMYLQCDEEITKDYTFERSRMFNKNYPVLKFNKTNKLEAHLWMVNTPYFEDLYPNNAQLYGCIFDVWYKNEIIKMESLGVGDKCTKTCTPGICNSGECLETYYHSPVCNCTSSFKNGILCNDKIKSQNIQRTQKVQFKSLKLSFKSTSENIFQLSNRQMSINLLAKDNYLTLIVNCSKNFHLLIETAITENYQNQVENIVILIFENSWIDIKFYGSNYSWIFIRIPYLYDLSRDVFEKLKLESKEGIIDFVYKNDPRETKWHRLKYHKEMEIVKYFERVNISNPIASLYKAYLNNTKENSGLSLIIESLTLKVIGFVAVLTIALLIIMLIQVIIIKLLCRINNLKTSI